MVLAALGAVALMPVTDAMAQPRRDSAANRAHAGHGWANRNTWAHQSASRRMGHAIEYSRDLRSYASYPRVVQPQEQPAFVPVTPYSVIVTEEVGRNIAAARQDIAQAKKAPKVADDADARKSFETIEKHLSAAAEQHDAMIDCCAGEECDADAMMKCCDAAVEHLNAAKTENEKLMMRLYPGIKKAVSQEAAEHQHEEK